MGGRGVLAFSLLPFAVGSLFVVRAVWPADPMAPRPPRPGLYASYPSCEMYLLAAAVAFALTIWSVVIGVRMRRAELRGTSPPSTLGGMQVLHYAWSSPKPFYVRLDDGERSVTEVPAVAICREPEHGAIRRVACDAQWRIVDAAPFDSVERAMIAQAPEYDVLRAKWHALCGDAGLA